MRHNKKFNHLGRTASHRKAMLANMASSLIKHKRITTTLAKAKALQMYVEPLITKSKSANNAAITPVVKTVEVVRKDGSIEKVERTINVNSSTPARRLVFSYLKDKDAVKELFGTVAPRIADRPGGYTRILKVGFRQGDAAEMAMIELVDFNEVALAASNKKEAKKATRRSRRKKDETVDAPKVEKAEKVEKAPKAEKTPKQKAVKEPSAPAEVKEDIVTETPPAAE